MSASAELNAFAADLGKIGFRAWKDSHAVMKKGAQNIKMDLQSGAKGSGLRGVVPSISYDDNSVGDIAFEIGPDVSRRGGALGHIYYLGTSRGGGTGDLEGPMMREAPNLERELGRVVDGWANKL